MKAIEAIVINKSNNQEKFMNLYSKMVDLSRKMPQNIGASHVIQDLVEFLKDLEEEREIKVLPNEIPRYKDMLKYIYINYDGTEESIRKIRKKVSSPERKYDEITTAIKMLGDKELDNKTENGNQSAKKFFRISKYLLEVRGQRHLPMLSEMERPEKVRFKEIIDYIDLKYDGTEESILNICNMIENREDMDDVLKHHDKEIKGETR